MKIKSLTLLIAATLVVFAPSKSFSFTSNDALIKYLQGQLKVPTELVKENEIKSVLVEVTSDETGKLHVLQTTSPDLDINMYVIHKLERIHVDSALLQPGKNYSFKIVFKVF